MAGTPVFNDAVLIERCMDDPAFAIEVVDLFVTSAQESLAAAQTLAAQGDTTALSHWAHKIKGSAGNVAAEPLAAAAAQLEARARAGEPFDRLRDQLQHICREIRTVIEESAPLKQRLRQKAGQA